jgi:ABC-type amino acid transport substrate-binding protein
MGGQKVAVLAGTTTEQDLRRAFGAAKVDADIRLMQTHQEGLDAVEKGTVVAYFADRAILTSLLQSGGRRRATWRLPTPTCRSNLMPSPCNAGTKTSGWRWMRS